MNLPKETSDSTASGFERKYVVTPGLFHYFKDFLHYCEAAENSPIIIVGPTGAGKSLFLHLFEKFFISNKRVNDRKGPITRSNCAHFGGKNSDPNIARSELFGQTKGSHAGAFKEKAGLVEVANGDSLILEEIGELPGEVQAMLLTFIEDGEYRRVGGNETKRAKVRIIGATNNDEPLRSDFKFRLLPFYIPHLCERRQDVLYYLSAKYPELTLSLTRNEVTSLLCYNWPGNVREIDRVAKLLTFHKLRGDSLHFADPAKRERYDRERLSFFDERQTKLRGFTSDLFNGLDGWGVDVQTFESMLNKYGIGLSDEHAEPAFKQADLQPKQKKSQEDLQWERQYDVSIMPVIDAFEDAFSGYLAFCGLFMQNPNGDSNILENLNKPDYFYFDLQRFKHLGIKEKKLEEIAKKVMQFLTNTLIPDDMDDFLPNDLDDYWDQIIAPLNESEQPTKEPPPILKMKKKELLKRYYEGLLKECNGNVAAAARKAGLKLTTLRSSLDALGIPFRKRIEHADDDTE